MKVIYTLHKIINCLDLLFKSWAGRQLLKLEWVFAPMSSEWFNRIELGDVNYVKKWKAQYLGSRNEEGLTGLMVASGYVSGPHKLIVEYLAQEEAGQTTETGQTALMIAAIVDNHQVIDILKCEAGMRDSNGFTASAWAQHAKSKTFHEYLSNYETTSPFVWPDRPLELDAVICKLKFRNMSFGTRPSQLILKYDSIDDLNQKHNEYLENVAQQSSYEPLVFIDDIGMTGANMSQNNVDMGEILAQLTNTQAIQYYKLLHVIQKCIERGIEKKIDLNTTQIDQNVYDALRYRFGDLIEYLLSS